VLPWTWPSWAWPTLIWSLAPRQRLPETLYSALDMMVVNEAEARAVVGRKDYGWTGPGLAEAIVDWF
jgi:hypothetical protein